MKTVINKKFFPLCDEYAKVLKEARKTIFKNLLVNVKEFSLSTGLQYQANRGRVYNHNIDWHYIIYYWGSSPTIRYNITYNKTGEFVFETENQLLSHKDLEYLHYMISEIYQAIEKYKSDRAAIKRRKKSQSDPEITMKYYPY